jgi:hypothetical protein
MGLEELRAFWGPFRGCIPARACEGDMEHVEAREVPLELLEEGFHCVL